MPETDDPHIAALVEKSKPLLSDPVDLIHVERIGLPPIGGTKPIMALKLYFCPMFDESKPQSITFLMDPDGAVDNYLATDLHVAELLAAFAPDTPVDDTPNPEDTES